MNNDFLYEKIKKTQMITKIEHLRVEFYSIFTILILSKDLFPSNKEIAKYLKALNFEIKPYLQKTRTGMLAKTLRKINNSDDDFIISLKSSLKMTFLKSDSKSNTNMDNSSYNYMQDIITKYGRNKNE